MSTSGFRLLNVQVPRLHLFNCLLVSNILNFNVWISESLLMPSNSAMPCNIDHANQVEVANEDMEDNLCTNAMV